MSVELPKFEITDKQKQFWADVRVFEITPEGIGEEWHISKFVNPLKPQTEPLSEAEDFINDYGKPIVTAVLMTPAGPDGKLFASLPSGELVTVDPIIPVTFIDEGDMVHQGNKPKITLIGTIQGHKKHYDGTIRKD